jgi:AraC-like DNA-binding protein
MLILNILTSANLILLFCLLFFRKQNALPNKILALILINPGINFLSNINVLSGYFFQYPYVYFFAQITCFLFAPLVHMYVTLLIGKKIQRNYPWYIVSLMAMGMSAWFAFDFSRLSATDQQVYLHGVMNEPYPIHMNITNGLFILLQQVYFTISLVYVSKYRKALPIVYSNYEKTKVSYITKFILLIWILNLSTIVLYATLPTIQVEYIYLPVVLTIIYFFILYYSFHHHSIFTSESYQSFVHENKISINRSIGLSNTQVDEEELSLMAERTDRFLNEEEIYRNPNLTLEMLSKEMNIPEGKLSLAINKMLRRSFYDLINEKRIEKSKLLLKEMSETNTIEYIAYESGFNSRASFYRAFKKHTSVTPTDYLKALSREMA